MTAFARSPDDVPIAYDVSGAGSPALVFVHGWSCDRTYWREQVEPFARRHRVVALDLAGHRESGAGRSSWTMPAFGDDVVADVDTYGGLGPPRPAEEVTQFLLPFRQDFVSTTRDFARGMFGPHSDPDLVDWVASDMGAAPRDLALDALQHAVTNDREIATLLDELALPVTAINSDRRPTDADGLAHHGVRTVMAPGVGHFPMLEDPAMFNLLLAGAVESLRPL